MRSRKKEAPFKPPKKLDRKSSRGIMFENEGLRMRTIEINAEVDRGQSDLRKLKKENETLKQQVWTLRDEYDKLETIVKGIDQKDEDDETDDAESSQTQPKMEMQDESDQESVNACTSNYYAARRPSLTYSISQRSDVDSDYSQVPYQDTGQKTHMLPGCHSTLPRPQPCENSVILDPVSDNTAVGGHNFEIKADEKISNNNHFNLDQLLDFASSFHYDRKKHCSDEEIYNKPNTPEDELSKHEVSTQRNDAVAQPTPPNFSALRRSSTVIERNLKAVNTGSMLKEVKQVSMGKDEMKSCAAAYCQSLDTSNNTTTVTYTRSSYYFAGNLDGRSQSLGAGLNAAAAARSPNASCGPLYSSSSVSDLAAGTTSSLEAGLPLVSVFSSRPSSLVRLGSIEPNTIMFSVVELPQLWSVTTQEIIDELEQQDSSVMPDVRGVRVTSRAAYISLGHRDTLLRLIENGLSIRGLIVPLIDINRESLVLSLTGVPHYIADATLSILLSAFGVIIGELERRFYKGVDTGERYVRIKIKSHVKLPKYVTVGGCRIVLSILGSDRHLTHYGEWNQIEGPGPPLTPHPPSFRERKDFYNTLVSPDSGQCSEPSSSEKACEKQELIKEEIPLPCEAFITKPVKKEVFSGQKTFASRCLVNLKLPTKSSPFSFKKSNRNTALLNTSTITNTTMTGSTLSAGHVLRAGSLCKSSRNSNPSEERNTNVAAQSNNAVPVIHHPLPPLPIDPHLKPELKARPSSVGFDEFSREHLRVSPMIPQIPFSNSGPPLMANGILRKQNISITPEHETLLPNPPQGATATIKNRLKLGRSAIYSSGKQKDKKKKGSISKMESISENTVTEEVTDITPLESSRSSRRDSEKGSNSDKPKKDVIDLPWCGCWGNGCF